jgi:hypothetical protein
VLIILLAAPAFAQIDTGVISGRVTDPSGAVVPGARLTLTETSSNTQSTSQTDSEGLYRVPSLRPGTYNVSVTADGFKAFTRAGVILRIGENLSLDVTLQVGAVTDSVAVTGALPLLQTVTSSTGQVVEADYLYKLPNYGHWALGALYYTPQVQTSNAVYPGQLGGFSVNGGTAYQIAYYNDGQMTTAETATGSITGNFAAQSVELGDEEVNVLTSVLPAEYGHAASGLITVVKKSGTNELHGDVGYVFQNTAMVQRTFFQLKTDYQQGITYNLNQPDFVVSGPVWIPKVYNGKNKTFFEVAGTYHWDSNSNPGSFSVPTQDMLNGVFNWAGANGIYDPASTSGTFAAGNLSRTLFPNNTIPASRMSNMWKSIMAVNNGKGPFGSPDSPGSFTGTGVTGNLSGAARSNFYGYGTQVRIDQNVSSKIRLFGSYEWDPRHQPGFNQAVVYAPFDAQQNYAFLRQSTGTVGLTYSISPTFISETRVGIYRYSNNPYMASPDYQFAIAKTVPNLPSNVYLNPVATGFTEGTYSNSSLGTATLGTVQFTDHQLKEDLTKVWKKHAFKFGYEWLWQLYDTYTIPNPRLTLNFGDIDGLQGNGVSIPNTGNITLAALQLGYVTSYSYAQQGASLLPEDSIHSLYFQDDWRVHPKLTINWGVRYSNESPAHSKFPGQLSEGSLTIPDDVYPASIANVVTCPAGGCVGGWIQPKGWLYNRDNDNFQPRVGLAWNPTPNFVVRAGYAINTQDMGLWWTNQSEIGGSSFYSQSVTTPNNVYTPLFNIGAGVPAPVYPAVRANGSSPSAASAGSGGQNRPNATLTVIPANLQNPYTENWNVSVQRALKQNYMVQLSYVGSHYVGGIGAYNWQSRPYGTGLDASGKVIDLTNPANGAYRSTWTQNSTLTQAYKPFPNWSGVNYDANSLSMIYHSGTVEMEKRYSYGLNYLAFFTYQKGLENNPGNLYTPQTVGRYVTSVTQKFRFTSSMRYELPLGRGKRFMNKGRWKDAIFGGYSFAWNYSFWTPTPVSLGYSGGTYVNPVTGAIGGRQDYPSYEPEPGSSLFLIQNPQLRSGWQDLGGNRFVQAAQNPLVTNCGTSPILQPNGASWGNKCVVAAPSYTNGNMPANMWTPERIIGADATVFKDFTIHERFKLQFRADIFNPFKWYNWNTLTTTMNQTGQQLFATIPLADFGSSNKGGPPQMQIHLRVRF